MNKTKPFSWNERAKSFVYAWHGILHLLRYEHNARLHIAATVLVLIMGFLFNISAIEWIAITLCIALVFAMEGINTAIEALADRITENNDEYIKTAKDVAAGAVLICAIASVIVAAIIFVPKIINIIM